MKHRLPAICDGVGFTDQGGLVYYGPDTRGYYARAAIYVDRILRGADPATMPSEQPQKFELVVNRRAAERLGFAIPRSILLRADRVID